jgi:hypothetical protein
MARASVNNAMRSTLADTANLLLDLGGAKVTTGSANAYLIALDTAPLAYTDNLLFLATANHSNTGAATINVNGIGVKDIKRIVDGAAVDLEAGNLPVGHIGTFTYSSSNNSVVLLNPSYIAVSYIPPSGIPRSIDGKLDETVSLTDFMIASDTDATMAWKRFGIWARAQSTAGKAVELFLPPGIYNHDGKLAFGACLGIKRLKILGYGAKVQNTYAGVAQFGFQMQFPPAVSGGANLISADYKIDSTVPYDTTVMLKAPADISHFVPGQWMIIGSVDNQGGYGQPLNIDRLDFAKITKVNDPGPGVITFTPGLLNYHRDDFADWGHAPTTQNWGKARVWALHGGTMPADSPAAPFDGPYEIYWDVSHHYEGFEIGDALDPAYSYLSTAGMQRTFTNMKLPALSESIAQSISGKGCLFTGSGEPDKLVDSIAYDSCIWEAGYTLQSSSINRISFINCKTPLLSAGSVKELYATACDFGSYGSGQLYGRARVRVLTACRIGSTSYTEYPTAYATAIEVQAAPGSQLTYANGLFTMPKVTANIYANVSPGQALYWAAKNAGFSYYPHDLGCMYVTRIYDDVTNIYIETTSPHAAIPSWALYEKAPAGSGVMIAQIYAERTGHTAFVNCFGGDGARRLSESTKKGEITGEYFKETFIGKCSQSGYWLGRAGKLKRIVVDVKQPLPPPGIAGATLELTIGVVTTTAIDDPKPLIIITDVNVKGRRDYDFTALNGKTTNDAVTLGGVAQTALPSNRTSGYQQTWFFRNFNPAGTTPVFQPSQLPMIEVEFYFDTGMFLRPLMGMAGQDPAVHIAEITGTMHP